MAEILLVFLDSFQMHFAATSNASEGREHSMYLLDTPTPNFLDLA